MKTYEYLLEYFKNPECIDYRDANRLAMFITKEDLKKLGVKKLKNHKPVPFTRENVLKQLEEDLGFAFEKALDKRGISSGLMFEVIRMWNNILEEGLENWPDEEYAMYGLPLYKATALKYGFDNPIGEDTGSEDYYNESWWY